MVASLSGILLFLAAVFTWVMGYQLLFAGRIFPGVSVAGVDVSGMPPQDAALKLSQTLSYPGTGKVLFEYEGKGWVASPAQLGMVFDASSSARSAYDLGRTGGLLGALAGQVRARAFGDDVAPVIVFDQRVAYQYLQGLAQQVDQPVVEAGLHLDGTNVVAQAGQTGRFLNVDATLIYVSGQLQSFRDGQVPLIVRQVQPNIGDASAQADAARQILSQPLQLSIPNAQPGDAGPWNYDVPVLAKMIAVQRPSTGSTSALEVTLNPLLLGKVLHDLEPQIDRQAQDARFHFNDGTGQLEPLPDYPSVVGRHLDVEASIQAINAALLKGQHQVALVVQETQPAVASTATARDLGIKGLLPNGVQTSYFRGSHAERIQNIETAAARFDGVMVAPGETFSMGETMGDVSLNNGFTEALIIYGGHTIKGVGGGVCQVSTTLFRTVFLAGFPVVERVPHAYRVSYYEETSSGLDPKYAGLDATVYFPLVDFKFTNDSAYWLLMETSIDVASDSLTWRLYSTYDGRTVKWDTSGPQNVVPAPDPLFKANPDVNHITQTDYAANGADVDVTRTVLKNGSVYFQDEFKTHYEPWQAVCEYPPGTDHPEKVAQRQNPPLCQPPSY
jgi:vancomycin resistance protein YoaR